MTYGKTCKKVSACVAALLGCFLMLACNPEKARSRDKPAGSGTRELVRETTVTWFS
jgi:hypothetical protein